MDNLLLHFKKKLLLSILAILLSATLFVTADGANEASAEILFNMYSRETVGNPKKFSQANYFETLDLIITRNGNPYNGLVSLESEGKTSDVEVIDGIISVFGETLITINKLSVGDEIAIDYLDVQYDFEGKQVSRYGLTTHRRFQSIKELTLQSGLNNLNLNVQYAAMEYDPIQLELEFIGGPSPRPDVYLGLRRYTQDGSIIIGEGPYLLKSGETQVKDKIPGISHVSSYGVLFYHEVDQVYVNPDFVQENYIRSVPEGYRMELDGFKLYNIYQIPITVTKVWEGGPDIKPDVLVQLYQNGLEYGKPVLMTSGTDTYTWTVDEMNLNGMEYEYTVDEVDVPEGYTKSVDGFVITNTYDQNAEPEVPEESIPAIPLEPSKPIDKGETLPDVSEDQEPTNDKDEGKDDLAKPSEPNDSNNNIGSNDDILPPTGVQSQVGIFLGIVILGLIIVFVSKRNTRNK